MKKILRSLLFIIIIIFILSPPSLAKDIDLKEQVKQEDGSIFEKIIAECIGGIAETILNLTTSKELNIGFKNYDDLIFNSNSENISLAPFNNELWNKIMNWYDIFAIISGSLILIAVFILSYKIMCAGMNISKKNEAKDSLMRLLFGGISIAFAPLFIRFLLFINNSLVNLLILATKNSSLEDFLGNGILSSIRTGNAIATALVIAMFIYLFVKINIKFIIRQFIIIIFTIFTPIACGLWVINKNVTAASIWAGQIIMNIFMQFIYCFLFLVYLAFLPSGGGWAISLIWAMMILPLADTLMNCLQNLTSRIAGVDNEMMANRVMGMGTMLGFGIGAIKEQFTSNSINSDNGLKGVVNKTKSVINPNTNLTAENDYNGNINPIRNVIVKKKIENSTTDKVKSNNINVAKKVAKTGFNVAKTYLNIGARMVEGDFNNLYNTQNRLSNKNNFHNTIYVNEKSSNNLQKKSGDENANKN